MSEKQSIEELRTALQTLMDESKPRRNRVLAMAMIDDRLDELASLRQEVSEAQRLLFEVGVEHSGMSLLHQVKQVIYHLESGHEIIVKTTAENNELRQQVEELRAENERLKGHGHYASAEAKAIRQELSMFTHTSEEVVAEVKRIQEQLSATQAKLQQAEQELEIRREAFVFQTERLIKAEAAAAAMKDSLDKTLICYEAITKHQQVKGLVDWPMREAIVRKANKALSTNAGATLLAVVEAVGKMVDSEGVWVYGLAELEAVRAAYERYKEGRQDG